jgi:GT2 family glycosyltransferase
MIFIIIPVFNRIKYTYECISSLIEQSAKSYKIIVVDHGSTDGTTEIINKDFPQVMVVKGDETMWWAGATNLGIKEALNLSVSANDFILTLNNDLIVSYDYIEQLLKVYQENKPCLVGSISVYYNNTEKVQYSGISWDPFFAKFKNNPIVNKKYSHIVRDIEFVESDLLSGRGTLIPIILFKEVGLFDEQKFPHYSADDDFSLNCKKRGYKLLISTKGVVKSYVDERGLTFTQKKLNLSQFFETLSSIKSANNLTIRYRWAKKNTPFPNLYFLSDVVRIFGSYCRSLIKKNL